MELELQNDFKEFFRLLNSNGVKYLLIGGYAVIVHGYVRSTSDIDLMVSREPANAERCARALAEFGFGESTLSSELFSTEEDSLVRIGSPPVQIEILNYLKGLEFDEAYARRKKVKVEDIEIDVISLEDLIRNKTEVARRQDLLDVEKLQERNPGEIGDPG
ncbi:MAG: nucleotidyltransferase [Blastocatellia bacterium]|nr:nucleotidyltransferase [Blastocatellia bacterium]